MGAPEPSLILASSSPYRRAQLETLGLDFETCSPDIDETRYEGEIAEDMVRRLSEAKARAVQRIRPGFVVVAGDQCAVLDDEVLGKPGGRERARAQLHRASGRTVTFLSGLAVGRADEPLDYAAVPVHVHFRALTDVEIERYLDRDEPFDCAGALRSEGYGAALLEGITSSDPSALLGLPRIALCGLLRRQGFVLP